MFALSLFALVSAATSLAAPAPAIVPSLTCRKSASAPLAIKFAGGAEAGIVNSQGATPVLVTTRNGAAATEQFDFYLCDSTFMNTQSVGGSGGSTFYGQLRRASDGLCVQTTSRPQQSNPTENTGFALKKCSFSDDSSQLFGTWKLVRSKGQKDGALTFINGRQAQENEPNNNGQGEYIYFVEVINPTKTVIAARPQGTGDGSMLLMKNVTNYVVSGPL
ncbi:hypothetical protein K437DRAFT_295835 [Tilletiaria anomala UBC 951]|uniref:Uncharacterized protein n=1 Tax=Tilletiaria anomala (strain ATCC 24038 / CBS 436.72 / UBC 951) TaxID=1037660 RepID=A0A066VJE1_TILAU|nr:uncharacterized protein K437DRAFT_295835 [Tilletiaria anomala UBC 951]KDN40418.1 hypothetical protein K437DRAFT_295835 [Tilletiaria anomala UBC 951]